MLRISSVRAQTTADVSAERKRRVRTKRRSRRNILRMKAYRANQSALRRLMRCIKSERDLRSPPSPPDIHPSPRSEIRTLGSYGRGNPSASAAKPARKRNKNRYRKGVHTKKNCKRRFRQPAHTRETPANSTPNIGRFNKNFKVATLNVRTLKKNQESRLSEIRAQMIHENIDLLAIQETKVIFPSDSDPSLQDFRLTDHSRCILQSAVKGSNGGVSGRLGLIISPRNADTVVEVSSLHERIMYIKLAHHPVSGSSNSRHSVFLHIFNIYAYTAVPGNEALTENLYSTLAAGLAKIPASDMLIILGDFNSVLIPGMFGTLFGASQSRSNLNSTRFENFLEEQQLYPVNARFRKKDNYVHTTFLGCKARRERLDYILSPKKWINAFVDFTTRLAYIETDHKLLIVYCKYKYRRQVRTPPIFHPNWNALQDEEVCNSFSTYVLENLITRESSSFDEDYQKFVEVTHIATSKFLPPITRRSRTHPWEGTDIQKLRDDLRDKRRTFHQTGLHKDYYLMKQAVRTLTQRYKANQRDYIRNQCREIEQLRTESQSKAAWDLIKCLNQQKPKQKGTIQGNSSEERSLKWYHHFSTLFESSSTSMNEEVPTLDPLFPSELFDNLTREYDTSPFSFGEITSALESLQNGKATGSDNIAAEALKVLALRHLILSFMNRALAEGATPELWRTLIIVPVPKKGDQSICANYRL